MYMELPWANGKPRDYQGEVESLLQLLNAKVSSLITSQTADFNHAVCQVAPEMYLEFVRLIRHESELAFDFLVDVTAVDYLDLKENRFELVCHFLSMKNGYRLRVKVPLEGENPEISSLTEIWKSAYFMEREVWDMYGIRFSGHPDLRRILMYQEFEGHPLRKDYPVQLKQPRVKLRHPEVENTARKMVRPDLVAITPKRKTPEKVK